MSTSDNSMNLEGYQIEPSLKPAILRSLMYSYNASFYTVLGLTLMVTVFLFAPIYSNLSILQQAIDQYINIIVALMGIPVGLSFWHSSVNRAKRKELDKLLYPEIVNSRTEDIDTEKLFSKIEGFRKFFETHRTARLIKIRNASIIVFLFELALTLVLFNDSLEFTPELAIYASIAGIGLIVCAISHLLVPNFYRRDLLKISLEANLPENPKE